ncbi:MAG: hypothetical protein ACREF4_08985 [Gammaproteobacteria bacterium]
MSAGRLKVAGLLVALWGGVAAPAAGQDSQFAIGGLGTPGRPEGVRARSTGGAFAPFDVASSQMEAALADVTRLTASAMGTTSHRDLDFGTTTAALRVSRFPGLLVSGGLRRGWVGSLGFSTYLDRTYRVRITDTLDLRGQPEPFTDDLSSEGAVTDVRAAVARRLTRRLAVGAAFHVLVGSTREQVSRDFENASYATAVQRTEVFYNGLGASVSLMADVLTGVRVAGWLRSDGHLVTETEEAETARNDMPVQAGAALHWQPRPFGRVAAAVAWGGWSVSAPGAFDTFNWSVGAELGGGSLPLRLGVRGGRLPYGPGAAAPTELGGAIGTGVRVARGRGALDFGVEYLRREGPGLTETIWTVMMGIGIRP